MKFFTVIIAITTFLCLTSNSQAKIVLDKEVKSQISRIMQQPVQVYNLDHAKGNELLKRIDDWSSEYLSISNAERNEYKVGNRSGLHLKMDKNIPVPAMATKIEGVQPTRPFDVFYIKEPSKRRFIKDLTVPTTKRLTEEEVKRLSKDFIERHGFYHKTDIDEMVASKVISRMRRRIDIKDGMGEELTLSQSSYLKRVFNGLEVFNSKQIVAFHPDSREVVSYRSLNWTPVDERSGKAMAYDSPEAIFRQIEGVFKTSPYIEKVSDLRFGMYLVNNMMVPVIRLKVQPQNNAKKSESIRKTLIVGLVKGLEVENPKREKLLPKEPSVGAGAN